MNNFWFVIRSWDVVWQWLFFAAVLAAVVNVFKYIAVMMHGWPPAAECEIEEEVEEEDD